MVISLTTSRTRSVATATVTLAIRADPQREAHKHPASGRLCRWREQIGWAEHSAHVEARARISVVFLFRFLSPCNLEDSRIFMMCDARTAMRDLTCDSSCYVCATGATWRLERIIVFQFASFLETLLGALPFSAAPLPSPTLGSTETSGHRDRCEPEPQTSPRTRRMLLHRCASLCPPSSATLSHSARSC